MKIKRSIILVFSVVALSMTSFSAYAQQDTPGTNRASSGPEHNGAAIGVNLAWLGIATPNISVELPVSDHLSLALSGGFKPKIWPRWSPFDNDLDKTQKWIHMAVIPSVRWWPGAVYNGFFLGADLIYAHYNMAGINLPLGIYPDIWKNRLQGDFYGGGLSAGGSFWLSDHFSLAVSAGAFAGYKNATRFYCPRCSPQAEDPTSQGLEVAPKLDVSIAYHIFSEKRAGQKK